MLVTYLDMVPHDPSGDEASEVVGSTCLHWAVADPAVLVQAWCQDVNNFAKTKAPACKVSAVPSTCMQYPVCFHSQLHSTHTVLVHSYVYMAIKVLKHKQCWQYHVSCFESRNDCSCTSTNCCFHAARD